MLNNVQSAVELFLSKLTTVFDLIHLRSNLMTLLGNTNQVVPLQYSCLENPIDGGAW